MRRRPVAARKRPLQCRPAGPCLSATDAALLPKDRQGLREGLYAGHGNEGLACTVMCDAIESARRGKQGQAILQRLSSHSEVSFRSFNDPSRCLHRPCSVLWTTPLFQGLESSFSCLPAASIAFNRCL